MSKKGYISPSQFSRIMTAADLKKGVDHFGTGATTYALELVCQRMGVDMPEAKAPSLEWGVDNEWEAIERYKEATMSEVARVEDPIHWAGSEWVRGYPDGLVGDAGLIEVKCPWNPVNHVRNLPEPAQYETDYKEQIQGYLLITGRQWCDFISFDPRFQDREVQLAIHRIDRDQEYLELLSERLLAFDAFVRDLYAKTLATCEH